MMKINRFKACLVIFVCLVNIKELTSLSYIKLNGEKIRYEKFTLNNGTRISGNKIEYSIDDNLSISPFFGQDNPYYINSSSIVEIAYSSLGYLCPKANKGKYLIDYKTPYEFLPLFTNSTCENSWDQIIFQYFSGHIGGIRQDFTDLWNDIDPSNIISRKSLLFANANKDVRELFYSKFINEEIVATYSEKTKKAREINAKIEANIKADLNEYLKNINIDGVTKAKIKNETSLKIANKLNAQNLIDIKYYRIKLNGTFLDIVKQYSKLICKKINENKSLTNFEQRFYDDYIKLESVFLITNLQYITYKIDKTQITNLISEFSNEINIALQQNNIAQLEGDFAISVGRKLNKEITEDFKSEGGYILQIAENAQFAGINTANCLQE